MSTITQSKIEKAFVDYERDTVRLRPELVAEAQEVHPQIRKAAEAAFPGMTTSWLSGSFGRKTQAGPKLKDIDVIVEFDEIDEILAAPPSRFLAQVANATDVCELVMRSKPCRRAVECTLFDYEFTVDIVPGICHRDGRRLWLANVSAKDGVDKWDPLHPRGQRDAAAEMNRTTGGLYIPTGRTIKYWNQSFGNDNKPLKSYHAEALVYHSIEGASGFVEAVIAFFDHAYGKLAPGEFTTDPGDPSQHIDDLLDADKRAAARLAVADARRRAHEAAELDDPDQAAEIWATIFPGFPSPGMSTSAVRRTLGVGLVPGAERERIRGRSWRAR